MEQAASTSEPRSGMGQRVSARFRRVVSMLRRAVGHAGPDRDALLAIVKAAVAATAAWVLAHTVLGAPEATFAPFTALLMVQATISQSLDQAARYAAAMVCGVVLAGVLTPMLGAAIWVFAGLIVVALIFGRWHRLGQQGPQVGVAALFAYSSFSQTGTSSASYVQLASIAGLVLLGCGIGVLTNLVVVPPMRYRSAEYGISSLARSLCDLLTDMATGLRAGVPDRDQAEEWQRRAGELPNTIAQARATVEHAAETMRFNPRRLFLRNTGSFAGHRTILNALEHATDHLRATVRGLTYAATSDHPHQDVHEQFLAAQAELLAAVAESARVLGQLHSAEDTQRLTELDEATDRARRAYSTLAEQSAGQQLDHPQQWPIYGAMQTDTHRLVDEFLQARDSLAELLEHSEHTTHASTAADQQ